MARRNGQLLGMTAENVLRTQVAGPEQQMDVLRLTLRGEPIEVRKQMARSVQTGGLETPGLIGCWRDEQLVGGTWCLSFPGRSALVWPCEVVVDESQPTQVRRALQEATDLHLASLQVRIAQAVLRPDAPTEALLEAGYEELAMLLYLVSLDKQFPAEEPAGVLQLQPYAGQRQRLMRIMERTYEGTQDCPGMDGVRSMEDVVEGYLHVGESGDAHWFFVQHEQQSVGCLLLADHPGDGHWELVYMGLVAEARGRKWGLDVTRHAQWRTGQAARSRLVLAVDQNNRPALRRYESAGFVSWDQRRVLIKVYGDSGPREDDRASL